MSLYATVSLGTGYLLISSLPTAFRPYKGMKLRYRRSSRWDKWERWGRSDRSHQVDRLDRPKELGKSDRSDWLNKLDKSYIPDRSAWTINGQMSQIV